MTRAEFERLVQDLTECIATFNYDDKPIVDALLAAWDALAAERDAKLVMSDALSDVVRDLTAERDALRARVAELERAERNRLDDGRWPSEVQP